MELWHLGPLAPLVCGVVLASAATLHVDQGHPQADDGGAGAAERPFRTISAAAAVARPGDTVQIAAGVYREHVSPAIGGSGPQSMIIYQARPGDRVVLKGSDPWKPVWTRAALEGVTVAVWRAPLDPALFQYDFPIANYNPFHQSPLKLYGREVQDYYAPVRPAEPGQPLAITRGAIFLEGQPLRQIIEPAHFQLASGVFMVSADGQSIFLRAPLDRDPNELAFEIVTREQVFAPRKRWLNFIHLKGLTFEHSANGNGVPQFGMVSATSGMYWIIEDCTIAWAGTFGMDIGQQAWYQPPGREDGNSPSEGKLDFDMIVRRCTFSDNGTSGLMCYSHGRSILVEDCVFEGNNRLGRLTWEEAGLKCHGVARSVFRNNLFRFNDSYGLWLDVCGANNRITQNLFVGNMNCGVFIEAMPETTLVDNNISIFSRPFTYQAMVKADGFYNHQAANVIFAHNLAYGNAGYGVRCLLWGESRISSGQVMRVSHNQVVNNILYANAQGAVSLPADQRLCFGNRSENNFLWGLEGAPLFELQRGIVASSAVVDLVEKAMAERNLPRDEAPFLTRWRNEQLGPTVADMRHSGPRVGLPLWQAACGRDLQSVAGALAWFRLYADGRMLIDTRVPQSTRAPVGIDGQDRSVGAEPGSYRRLAEVRCERLPNITHDYFGRLRPADRPPTVGPIQDLDMLTEGPNTLPEGETMLELWPNAAPDRPPATEMRIDLESLPIDEPKT